MGDALQQHGRVVGVFDSGFGGLTVLRALLTHLPGTHFIYLGDTARLPYGDKSRATVARYAIEAARFLVEHGAQLLVIACNTATALALPDIRAAVNVPVVGVVEPGAQAAFAAAAARKPGSDESHTGNVLILATAATVQSHAYRDTCAAIGLQVTEMPCPLLVPLVEEGWTDHPVTREVLRIYLAQAIASSQPDAVLLGCTHYPLIAEEVVAVLRDLGSEAHVVDSAQATAETVATILGESAGNDKPATFECFATDSVAKFARLGSRFLGRAIPHVELLDLGG
ncbi:MAG: glutamate racemase [Janthinobacterium lividum]